MLVLVFSPDCRDDGRPARGRYRQREDARLLVQGQACGKDGDDTTSGS